MRNKRVLAWSILLIAAFSLAGSGGLALGMLAKSGGWNASLLMLAVGLVAGMGTVAFKWPSANEQLGVSVVATMLGVTLFVWGFHPSSWQADTVIADEDLDPLCVRVIALRLCHERQVMGVFDFQDVPQGIVDEASSHVEDMSLAEKAVLCDRTFGDRINACTSDAHAGAGGASISVARILLALSASAVPILIRHRVRPVEA